MRSPTRSENLARGTHTVNAVIRDADGVEKIRSTSRSFSIQQTTINNPRNVGPVAEAAAHAPSRRRRPPRHRRLPPPTPGK